MCRPCCRITPHLPGLVKCRRRRQLPRRRRGGRLRGRGVEWGGGAMLCDRAFRMVSYLLSLARERGAKLIGAFSRGSCPCRRLRQGPCTALRSIRAGKGSFCFELLFHSTDFSFLRLTTLSAQGAGEGKRGRRGCRAASPHPAWSQQRGSLSAGLPAAPDCSCGVWEMWGEGRRKVAKKDFC